MKQVWCTKKLADTAAYAQRDAGVHSPDGSTFLCEMISWMQSWNPTLLIDCVYLENNSSKFHSDPIWNNGAQPVRYKVN